MSSEELPPPSSAIDTDPVVAIRPSSDAPSASALPGPAAPPPAISEPRAPIWTEDGHPTFVDGGPGQPPMPLRTPADIAAAAARVSRREAEVSAREAHVAEREASAAVAEAEAKRNNDARAASVLQIAGEAEAAAAASKVQAANDALAAQLERRETSVRARDRASPSSNVAKPPPASPRARRTCPARWTSPPPPRRPTSATRI